LTNKSTSERLDDLGAAGKLVLFAPLRDPDEPEIRRIWMMPALHTELYKTGVPQKELDYLANVRAFLGRFVKGASISNEEDMFLLDPHERDLWELRFTLIPQSRVFGALAYQDCFVATNWALRDNLGPKGSKAWLAAEQKAIDIWDALLPGVRRFHCRSFSNCITNGIDTWLRR
jgi:hypothetical protein